MGIFERFLTVWVAAAILFGVGLGLAAPGVFEDVAGLEVTQVNLVVAVVIWLMIYPMILKVEPDCLSDVCRRPKRLALTLTINWLVKPFTMAGWRSSSFGSSSQSWFRQRRPRSTSQE